MLTGEEEEKQQKYYELGIEKASKWKRIMKWNNFAIEVWNRILKDFICIIHIHTKPTKTFSLYLFRLHFQVNFQCSSVIYTHILRQFVSICCIFFLRAFFLCAIGFPISLRLNQKITFHSAQFRFLVKLFVIIASTHNTQQYKIFRKPKIYCIESHILSGLAWPGLTLSLSLSFSISKSIDIKEIKEIFRFCYRRCFNVIFSYLEWNWNLFIPFFFSPLVYLYPNVHLIQLQILFRNLFRTPFL